MRKLIVLAFDPWDAAGHSLNELLGYKDDALAAGLDVRIFVARDSLPDLYRMLDASPTLPRLAPAGRRSAAGGLATALAARNAWLRRLWDFVEAHDRRPIDSRPRRELWRETWRALDGQNPTADDVVFFTNGHPVHVAGIGEWLESRSPATRPWIFFRLLDTFEKRDGVEAVGDAAFFRKACAELGKRPIRDRIAFLCCSEDIAQNATHLGARRVFVTPLPTYFGDAGTANPRPPSRPNVYVNVNYRSERFVDDLEPLVRYVNARRPAVEFAIKYQNGERPEAEVAAALQSLATVLPRGQSPAEYLDNFSRASLVVLAYSSALARNSSGVFVEAAALGKPLVVPDGTWMARQIEAGRGVGVTFARLDVEALGDAIATALSQLDDLGARARALTPGIRSENSSRRYLERMLALLPASN